MLLIISIILILFWETGIVLIDKCFFLSVVKERCETPYTALSLMNMLWSDSGKYIVQKYVLASIYWFLSSESR